MKSRLTALMVLMGAGTALIGSALAEETTPPRPPAHRPMKKYVSKIIDRSPVSRDPAYLASTSSLIIRGRIVKKEKAASVVRHPLASRQGFGDYAWHDFLVEPSEVIWRDKGIPLPGKTLRVRVYAADGPDVNFFISGEPEFVVGEEYILMLRDTDGLAFNAGPPHWRPAAGTRGSFLITEGQVLRKRVDTTPFGSVETLRQALQKGVSNEIAVASHRNERAYLPKGIRFE